MVTEVTDQKGILLSKFDVGVLVDAVQQDLCAEVLRAGVRAVKDKMQKAEISSRYSTDEAEWRQALPTDHLPWPPLHPAPAVGCPMCGDRSTIVTYDPTHAGRVIVTCQHCQQRSNQ
jgi:hypothetical protein